MPDPIQLSDEISQVNLWVAAFDVTGFSPALAARLNEARAQLSPVVRFAGVAECIYANRTADMPPAALALGAQCANICRLNGWQFLGDPRGNGVVKAFRRDYGEAAPEGASWPATADDPALRAEWTVSLAG